VPRIESGGGSYQEQYRGVVDQRDREQQPLLLAAESFAAVAPGELLERVTGRMTSSTFESRGVKFHGTARYAFAAP